MAQWLVRLTPDLRSFNGRGSISRHGYRLVYYGRKTYTGCASLQPGVKVCAGKFVAWR